MTDNPATKGPSSLSPDDDDILAVLETSLSLLSDVYGRKLVVKDGRFGFAPSGHTTNELFDRLGDAIGAESTALKARATTLREQAASLIRQAEIIEANAERIDP